MKKYSATKHGKKMKEAYINSHREQLRQLHKKWYQKHKDKISLKIAIKKRNRVEQKIKDPTICFDVRAICRAIHGGDETIDSIRMYNQIIGIVIREHNKIV